MKRFISGKILALVTTCIVAATLLLPSVALAVADTHQHIVVTAKALFLSITEAQLTWTINGIAGSGNLAVDTIYYSNPVGETTAPSATVTAGECYFNVSNGATATPCDLTVTMGSFTGGDTTMTNSGTGANGATTYGAYCYYDGMTFANAVMVKVSGSNEMYNASTGLAAGATLAWGMKVETRTDAWTGGGASTADLVITATEH